MSADYEAQRVQRTDAMKVLRFQARASFLYGTLGLSFGFGILGWTMYRMDNFEMHGGSKGTWAVIDKCGQSYEFQTLQANAWDPSEGLYFDKLESIVECTRGLQTPAEKGKSCWPKAYAALGEQAVKQMNEFVLAFDNTTHSDMDRAVAEMQKRTVEVKMLPGAVKSEDGRYRLFWRETERDARSGSVTRIESWSGVFTVSRVPATPESVAAGNAIGLQIESFTWQRDKEQG